MYYLTATVRDRLSPDTAIDLKVRCVTLRVEQGTSARGSFYMPHWWRTMPPEPCGNTEPAHVAARR